MEDVVTEPMAGYILEPDKVVKLETAKGDIYVSIDPVRSPVGSSHFVRLAEDGLMAGMAVDRQAQAYIHVGPATEDAQMPDWRIMAEEASVAPARGYVFIDHKNDGTAEPFGFRILRKRDDSIAQQAATSGGMPLSLVGKVAKGMDVVDTLEPEDAITTASVVPRAAMGDPDPAKAFLDPDAVPPETAWPHQLCPQFEVQSIDGATFTETSTLGHVTVLAFWAMDVEPSVELLDIMQRALDRVSSGELQVFAVSAVDTDEQAIRDLAEAHGWDFTLVSGNSPGALEMATAFQATAVPASWVIDTGGVAIQSLRGRQPEGTVLAELERAGLKLD